MQRKLSRREFLKMSSFLMASAGSHYLLKPGELSPRDGRKNILILVYDAWSALNVSLYGYGRETTPNLSRMAAKATVYHNHFAGANWTYPGTMALITGAYPFTTRGFNGSHEIREPFKSNNLFGLFEDYYRIAYTHNPVAENVLNQFLPSIDHYQPRQSLYLRKNLLLPKLFERDYDIASLSYVQGLKRADDGYAYSLFLSNVRDEYYRRINSVYADDYPLGLPAIERDNSFVFEEATDWVGDQVGEWQEPFMAYLHYLPPHAPFHPRRGFLWQFNRDGFSLPEKPLHFLGDKGYSNASEQRARYDEFILQVDHEIGRLFDQLTDLGVLDTTLVVITSDHGEIFERGIVDHRVPVFHQPLARVPLMVFDPGQNARQDIYAPTSAVDLLPTLLHLTGREIPPILEGRVLPPYEETSQDAARALYALDARKNPTYQPLKDFTIMMVRWPYKISYYRGYDSLAEEDGVFEMYDLESDPEEMVNLYSTQSPLAQELAAELLAKVEEADQPYQSTGTS